MKQLQNFENDLDEKIFSCVFYCSSRDDVTKIQKNIDHIFSNYSFYPEIDWGKYCIRPPEGYQILGAWRQPESKVFVFLLDNPFMLSIHPNIQMILYVAGEASEVKVIETKLDNLKTDLKIEYKKEEITQNTEKRLEKFETSKSLRTMAAVLGVLTAIINVFSLYLRKLPPPNFSNHLMKEIYSDMVIVIHFSSLLLLFIVILIVTIFSLKYGLIFIRRI